MADAKITSEHFFSESRQKELRSECCYFHGLFFDRLPSEVFIESYIKAHQYLSDLHEFDKLQAQSINTIVIKRLNALHIEPWLRSSTKKHLLSSKLLLIASLAECDGKHGEFIRKSDGFWRGYTSLIFAGTLGIIKLIHGLILVKIYGIV